MLFTYAVAKLHLSKNIFRITWTLVENRYVIFIFKYLFVAIVSVCGTSCRYFLLPH